MEQRDLSSSQSKCEESEKLCLPIVDGEGKVVSWGRQTITSPPGHGGGEVPGGEHSTSGNLGEHVGCGVESEMSQHSVRGIH